MVPRVVSTYDEICLGFLVDFPNQSPLLVIKGKDQIKRVEVKVIRNRSTFKKLRLSL